MGVRPSVGSGPAFSSCKSAIEALLNQRPDSDYEAIVESVMDAVFALASGSRQVLTDPMAIFALEQMEDTGLSGTTDADALRTVFEQLLALRPTSDGGIAIDTAGKKASGTYYTPYYIVKEIVARALEPILSRCELTSAELSRQGAAGNALLRPYLEIAVLDAAAGTGRFLSVAARQIAGSVMQNHALAREIALSEKQLLRLVAESCVYGVDLDAAALRAAAFTLAFEAEADMRFVERLMSHFRRGNVLTSVAELPELPLDEECGSFHWQNEFCDIFSRTSAGFDAVVGNPPWISFSGRESSNIDKGTRSALYNRWRSAKGWPSSHGVFLEIAAGVCREGGRIGQIIPEQILDLPGYANARKAIFARTRLVGSPISVDEKAFAGVTSPACILVLEKGDREMAPCGPPVRVGATLTAQGVREIDEDESILTCVIRKMQGFPPLPSSCFGDPGVHTGNCGELLVNKNPAPGLVGMRIGRDVHRYRAAPHSLWLDNEVIPQDGQYFRVRPLETYLRSRILIRQTASYPVAARHTEPTYFRNSILAFYGCEELSDDYVLALLNSRPVRFFHQYLNRDGRQRSFPQVKVGHLRFIPFPRPGKQPCPDGALVEALMSFGFAPGSEVTPSVDGAERVIDTVKAAGEPLEACCGVMPLLARRMEELGAALNAGDHAAVVDSLIDDLACILYGISLEEQGALREYLEQL